MHYPWTIHEPSMDHPWTIHAPVSSVL